MGLPTSSVVYVLPEDCADSLGVWTGMMWSVCSVFAFSGPPIVGRIVRTYHLPAVGYWCGANLLVGSTLLVLGMLHRFKYESRNSGNNERRPEA